MSRLSSHWVWVYQVSGHLRNFRDEFWMQQTGTYRERTKNGIPYRERSLLHITGALTVNGERFSIAGDMPARRRFSRYPIVLYYLGG